MSDFDNFMAAADWVDRQIQITLKNGGNMSNIRAAYTRALNSLADNVVTPGEMLRNLDRDAERYPDEYVRSERDRLVRFARDHHPAVIEAINGYMALAQSEARKLRVQAEADRPAAERTAEMLERQQVLASGVRADALLEQAEEALAADRPRRAAFLLDAARSSGGAITLGDLPDRVENALDADDVTRGRARAIEDEAEAEYVKFEALRLRALVAAGVGLSEDGGAGRGTPADLTRANTARKMAAYFSGGDFSDPAPESGDGIVAVAS